MEPSAFISYSHADQKWLDRLEEMLVPLVRGGLDIWSDKRIKAGDDWRQEIEEHLNKATVAVLLVSPKFIASDFIHNNELPPLLEAARQRGLRVLWVLISDCIYEITPIGAYQAAYPVEKPLRGLRGADQDAALKAIALEIQNALTHPPSGLLGHAQADPTPSLASKLAQLGKPEASQRPLASLRKNHGNLPVARMIQSLEHAIALRYPGQRIADRFPDFSSQGALNSWDALEDYFADGKGMDAQLLTAWDQALQSDVLPDEGAPVMLALVVSDSGTRDQQADSFDYAAYRFVASEQVYRPLGASGSVQLDLQNPDAAVASIGAIIEEILAGGLAQQLSIRCIEIFAPWQLIEADWADCLKIKDGFGDLVPIVHELPFLVRSADRLRMKNKLPGLLPKITRLHGGEGQWLPASVASDPARLQVVDTQDSLVALHSHGPQRAAVDAATWLKALLKSMVPLALWTMPRHGRMDLEEHQFFECLWALELMPHGDMATTRPTCSDVLGLAVKRREVYSQADCLRHLHLLIDTPHQPMARAAQLPV